MVRIGAGGKIDFLFELDDDDDVVVVVRLSPFLNFAILFLSSALQIECWPPWAKAPLVKLSKSKT